jgi:hypothetical protein
MKKPRTGQPRRKKRVPSMRFKLDGEWWTVKVGRPPSKELCEGMTDYKRRVVWFHPNAIAGNLCGIVSHELAHVNFVCADETHVRDHERLVSVVTRWLAKTFNEGRISIGQHRRDK